ncbi:MAG TPA: metal-dependent transcriptional regulator [Planctomycetota bacterium]|jgi:DtxR family Mn-dependent transcriptional regulator|nr:metal-dependent transcriptional regulator [Planctomycetota bacterium]OQC20931.1 MAG: Iron-dependent repressor IdeR [Planctomycetes bacterium ADurb.Bin069]NMD36165.1 metal-dependent transcriptional regulator [Planctomycetota bacterium]HNR98427.1 metal-dependent transcriptional regulator [Planctomycetota bacterium]HNU25153.1 metal-dependent transcriptional regulator [Planctomycetota bacterium]
MQDFAHKILHDGPGAQSLFEDETLETVWDFVELGHTPTVADVVARLGDEARVRAVSLAGFITIAGDRISLTPAGKQRARDVVRRHRLAERLFADVLDIKDYEADACHFEHVISPAVEEGICTLLGHPPLCPHGKPIPKGACCKLYTRKLEPLVHSLTDAEIGALLKVTFITSPGLQRLAGLGLVPGATLRLQQKLPAFVINIGETTVAIDRAVASGIFVRHV